MATDVHRASEADLPRCPGQPRKRNVGATKRDVDVRATPVLKLYGGCVLEWTVTSADAIADLLPARGQLVERLFRVLAPGRSQCHETDRTHAEAGLDPLPCPADEAGAAVATAPATAAEREDGRILAVNADDRVAAA